MAISDNVPASRCRMGEIVFVGSSENKYNTPANIKQIKATAASMSGKLNLDFIAGLTVSQMLP